MNFQRVSRQLAFGLVAVTLISCSPFRRGPGPAGPATTQDYDPVTQTWRPSRGAVAPGPSQPAAPMERAQPANVKPEKEGFFKRTFKKLPFTGS